MRLDWFRTHKQIVYYILCPAIVVSMSIFGISSCSHGTSFFGGVSGPGVSYTVGNKEVSLSPAEVFQLRQRLYRYVGVYRPKDNQYESNPTTDNVGLWMAELEAARQSGFELGYEEEREILRNSLRSRIKSMDNIHDVKDEDIKLSEDLYDKFLSQLDMTRTQYESLIYDLALREKFHANVGESVVVPDPRLYVKYAEAKETVRIRYKTLKSDDFLAKTTAPTEAEISSYYKDNVTSSTSPSYKDVFMVPATLSVEAIAFKDEKAFQNLPAPTDKEIQDTYDQYKNPNWKADKAGEYKPLATVKDDVIKKFKETQRSKIKNTVSANLQKALDDLRKEEEAFAKDPANKDKKFDYAAFAQKHQLTYWVTPEQVESKYTDTKLEVNSPTLSIGRDLFAIANRSGPNEPEALKEIQMSHFTPFRWIDEDKPELGGIVGRKKVFNKEKARTQAEAKDFIIPRLKNIQAAKLAKEEAEKLRESWRKGESLPKFEELEEVSSETKEQAPIVQSFRRNEKPVGEPLDVAEGQPEGLAPTDYSSSEKRWYYVGCAVERKLPTLGGFKNVTETAWSRKSALEGGGYRMINGRFARVPGITGDDYSSMLGLMVAQIKTKVNIVGNRETEPDVRRVYRNAPVDSDSGM